jgi:CrcB protein
MRGTLLVGLGGLVGSVARYWVHRWLHSAFGASFPIGTLAVNVAGSFLIGFLLGPSPDRALVGPTARLLLVVGFCGGFTTMSAFSWETLALAAGGDPLRGAANVGAMLVGCFTATWLGMVTARAL